ncbi:unnamed protein product, partial [Iphiclides podalirius]
MPASRGFVMTALIARIPVEVRSFLIKGRLGAGDVTPLIRSTRLKVIRVARYVLCDCTDGPLQSGNYAQRFQV